MLGDEPNEIVTLPLDLDGLVEISLTIEVDATAILEVRRVDYSASPKLLARLQLNNVHRDYVRDGETVPKLGMG